VRGREQGALPLDPAKNLFGKKVLGTPKTFGKILGLIFCGSVLNKRTAASIWGPCPIRKIKKVCFALERTVREACPYRFDVLSVENPVVFAVLFEAAKAKSALCDNRACLAKNAIAFFACNARSSRDT
jgi:hypothetical protein